MAHKNSSNLSPYKSRQKAPRTRLGTHKKPEKIFSLSEANDRLYDFFKNHEFSDISHQQREQFAKFYVLLMQEQEKQNFTRLTDLRDIALKHFIDCLMVPRLTRLQFPLLDVGTGPGFPGIPLKLIYPKDQIILAEGVQKRVEFLKKVRTEIDLKQLDIVGRNINEFFFYPVRGVITRAVEDVRNTLLNCRSCLQMGGRVYLMKGPGVDPEIEAAKKEVGAYYKLLEDHSYCLPKTEQKRRLLVYEKVQHFPLIDPEDEPWPEEEKA